jgi:outer membrane lipoprotein carrier protein
MKITKIFSVATILVLSVNSVNAQTAKAIEQDPKAKKILDEVSAKTKTYSSINAEFSYTLENKAKKTSETHTGKLTSKGNKFKLEVANQTIINDGKTSWTILPESKEVQINSVSASDKDESINPSNIFTIYEKGFKYQFEKEQILKNGGVQQVIKLFPTDPKKKNFHQAILTVDKTKKQIVSLKVFGKDGQDVTYNVKKFEPNTVANDAPFTFTQATYKGYEIVDLRE